jgi:hypothetical protein
MDYPRAVSDGLRGVKIYRQGLRSRTVLSVSKPRQSLRRGKIADEAVEGERNSAPTIEKVHLGARFSRSELER